MNHHTAPSTTCTSQNRTPLCGRISFQDLMSVDFEGYFNISYYIISNILFELRDTEHFHSHLTGVLVIKSNLVASRPVGLGSIPSEINFLVGCCSRIFLNCKVNIRKFRPLMSPGIVLTSLSFKTICIRPRTAIVSAFRCSTGRTIQGYTRTALRWLIYINDATTCGGFVPRFRWPQSSPSRLTLYMSTVK